MHHVLLLQALHHLTAVSHIVSSKPKGVLGVEALKIIRLTRNVREMKMKGWHDIDTSRSDKYIQLLQWHKNKINLREKRTCNYTRFTVMYDFIKGNQNTRSEQLKIQYEHSSPNEMFCPTRSPAFLTARGKPRSPVPMFPLSKWIRVWENLKKKQMNN